MFFINEEGNDRFYNQPDVKIESNVETDILLNSVKYNHIFFGTDWHLYRYNDETEKIEKNKDYEKILSNYKKMVTDKDVFIFLGDLVDDEFEEYDILVPVISSLPGTKIMILGNNDLQPTSFYNECGFEYVYEAYQWRDYTFSHLPLKSFNTTYNIHGHMHGWWDYDYQGVYYNNHIKLYTKAFNNFPISLYETIQRYKKGQFLPPRKNINSFLVLS